MSKLSLNFIFLLALTSCGKKVEDVKNASVINHQDASTSRQLTIDYQHSAFSASQTIIPRNAHFKIPEYFAFSSQALITKPFHIYYNVVSGSSLEFEFKCVYLADNQQQLYQLSRCYNFFESDLGNVVGIDFMLDEGKAILMNSQEANTFHAVIDHQVEWK